MRITQFNDVSRTWQSQHSQHSTRRYFSSLAIAAASAKLQLGLLHYWTQALHYLMLYAASVAVLAHKIWGHGPMASAVARAYYGSLGAESPAGSRGRGSGAGPLKLQRIIMLQRIRGF